MSSPISKFVVVDGIRTHYLEAGAGPTLVLIHSGEFGACAELSWEFNIGPLSDRFHVIAPDWLGFGLTDKIYDFGGGTARRLEHMRRFLEVMCIDQGYFMGNSMGGSALARIAASDHPIFPIRALVLASGGGFAPDNEARRALLTYDQTLEGMRRLLDGLFADPKWSADEAYVQRRYELSLIPGAWECVAAPRFKAPVLPERSEFGQPDTTPYENIAVPTLVMAGAKDKLRLPGYALDLAKRILKSEVIVFENCGHCPNIEQPVEFNTAVIKFLSKIHHAEAVTASG